MSATPLFSILIPTKNRASLLRSALESLRRQTFLDFEVIVSDDHSADDTIQVVESFRDERFRLVHPPTTLTMADHYDFVASHARGEYINFLPDRSVMYSAALASLAQIIEQHKPPLIGWNNDRYDDARPEARNFHQFSRSRRLVEYPSGALLRLHYDFCLSAVNFSVASPASSACHRSVVDKVKAAGGGRLVYPFIPDITYSVSVLAVTSSFLYYDGSLSVGAGYDVSVGANLGRTREQGFKKLVGTAQAGVRTPCPGLLLNSNLVADDLLMVKEMYEGRLTGLELNHVHYFEKMVLDLMNIEIAGGDAGNSWDLFYAGLRQMPPALQTHIQNVVWTYRLKRQYPGIGRERIIHMRATPVLDAIAWAEANPVVA